MAVSYVIFYEFTLSENLDQAVTVLEATKFFENRAQAQDRVNT